MLVMYFVATCLKKFEDDMTERALKPGLQAHTLRNIFRDLYIILSERLMAPT